MATKLTMQEGVPCLICGAANRPKAFLCNSCYAPMALVYDTIDQRREPNIVSVIGESNVGKTVYLGFLLDMLSQRAGDFEAIPKGPYSIDLQQNVISHMSNRCFPPKTPMEPDQWHWAYYQVRKRGRKSRWIDLVMPDMAGETIAAEMAAPESFRVIHNLLEQSAALMLMVDAGLAANGSARPDFFAIKMLSYIDSIYQTRRNEKIDIPVAIILSKSDYCPECFDDPYYFVKANLNRLWSLCEDRFGNAAYFACSVVGSLGYATSDHDPQGEGFVVPIPFHTALQGILEPFEWIVNQI